MEFRDYFEIVFWKIKALGYRVGKEKCPNHSYSVKGLGQSQVSPNDSS